MKRRRVEDADGLSADPVFSSPDPRYATVGQFLASVRTECEIVRGEVREDWIRYRDEKAAAGNFIHHDIPRIRETGNRLRELVDNSSHTMEPQLRMPMIVTAAEDMISSVNLLKSTYPKCIYNFRFDNLIENLTAIALYAKAGRIHKISTEYLSKGFMRDLDGLVKQPEKPLDDPALEFVPKKTQKDTPRKELLWKSDGLDAICGKFVSIFAHIANKKNIMSVEIDTAGKRETYWLVNDMALVIKTHCIGKGEHPFHQAVAEVRTKCGTPHAELIRQLSKSNPESTP